jgi:pyruvate,orthophosphate dikinase
MVKERLIDWKTAITRVPADQLDQVLAPVFDAAAEKAAKRLCKGLPAGPGAASGKICLNAERAVEAAKKSNVLLVRQETSPEDLRGMIAAEGILTARGGVSSHAALVARQMGKVCVCGAADLDVDYHSKTVKVDGKTFKEGDYLSINGTSGEVFSGELKTAPSEIIQVLIEKKLDPKKSKAYQNFAQIMKWCEQATKMTVRTNADSPSQVANAVAFGATGIGLCRTEHMFFEGNRIDAMRQMILADDEKTRRKALKKLLPYQRRDFLGIFKALDGKPATIRLLDPPLHEFLPHDQAAQRDLAKKLGVTLSSIKKRVEDLHEFNPMLGHRGCRLGISYPEVTEMQAQAIFEAALLAKKDGVDVSPELMVPLVGFPRELELQVEVIHETAKKVFAAKGDKVKYLVGTMIEIPRAALVADEIAKTAQFFSFGTNDLTQTTMGMSRDDSGSFLPNYAEIDILDANPFASVDRSGVGQLMEIAVKKGKSSRRGIKLGICGEHGGDPKSVEFCHKIGLNYVSCSPFRVPTARLAAAQAAVSSFISFFWVKPDSASPCLRLKRSQKRLSAHFYYRLFLGKMKKAGPILCSLSCLNLWKIYQSQWLAS